MCRRRRAGRRSPPAGTDALAGPGQGLAPTARRQFDQGGDVSGQRAGVLLHVGANAGAEGGADPLAGGRADEAAALDRCAQRGVAAAPDGGDGVVEVVDVIGDGVGVVDQEPMTGRARPASADPDEDEKSAGKAGAERRFRAVRDELGVVKHGARVG